jgi:hypothetical protein
MKILDDINLISPKILERLTTEYKEEYLTSPNNEYVVFSGTAKIVFEGTIEECVAFIEVTAKKYLAIYSKEAYNKMIEKISRKL